ncbi:MAG TPA: hypothetical protein VMB78_12305, partial [Dissulfurispiraceae bacterium]|nr:hypothetical protein [Dissulfurispiraceae bacterium]
LKDGIHILVVTDIKGTTVPFDKMKDAIGQQLMAKKQQEGLEQFIEGLKKNYKPEINKDNLAKINLGGNQPAAPEKAPGQPAAPEKAPAQPAPTKAPEKTPEKAPEKAPEKK